MIHLYNDPTGTTTVFAIVILIIFFAPLIVAIAMASRYSKMKSTLHYIIDNTENSVETRKLAMQSLDENEEMSKARQVAYLTEIADDPGAPTHLRKYVKGHVENMAG